ncbi:hypothetical protein FOMG_19845 [Fusarium oxysporum f. sp. melonis 26406]|uniref:Uncharacterized protein n=1 Tax=Fusarium oxysporum f. sp. melonis 26406 TaxID=1089452 RepID=W9YW12_FUSOX|nr:hypothetical protein FOMG_19845 [Fusarium oxysporum f. sp. melonis 26406]KAJ9413316.1 ras family-domain-containing protein [Fusarium oxysporum]
MTRVGALYKLAVIGGSGVGKTALVIQFCFQHFVEAYDPTIEDLYSMQATIDGEPSTLEILDTAGKELYSTFYEQTVRYAEGFILIYSITSRSSFGYIEGLLRHVTSLFPASVSRSHCKPSTLGRLQIPVILVGNKIDKDMKREVATQEGHAGGRYIRTRVRRLCKRSSPTKQLRAMFKSQDPERP